MKDIKLYQISPFFLTYGTERAGAEVAHERSVLVALGGWGNFIASSDAQLLPVRQVAVFREKLTLEGNTTMAADEKLKKIVEIDARLKALDAELAKAGG